MQFIYRPCAHSNKFYGLVTEKESLNQPKGYQIFKNDSVP
jgi:hypothetical protein